MTGSQRRLLGSALFALAAAVPLLALLFPVRNPLGPGWIGHSYLRFDFVAFVPAWRVAGRDPHFFFLGSELALAMLVGLGVWISSSTRRWDDPKGRGTH